MDAVGAGTGFLVAVLRCAGERGFVAVARVRADSSTHLSWTDATPPRGHLRYRVRRECVDARYQWLSPEVQWPAPGRKLQVQVASHLPGPGVADLEVRNALAGSLEILVFDVAGRLVARYGRRSQGTGIDRLELRLDDGNSLRSGVYFVLARDASGAQSEAAKLVVLR